MAELSDAWNEYKFYLQQKNLDPVKNKTFIKFMNWYEEKELQEVFDTISHASQSADSIVQLDLFLNK